MKRMVGIVLLMVLVAGLAPAAVTVQAGIFAVGTHTIQVKAKVSGGTASGLLSSVSVPVVWPTASGISVASVDYAPGLGGTDEGTSGGLTYAVYNMASNANTNWLNGSENLLLTITFTGTGPVSVSLQNGVGPGDWYIEVGDNVTNSVSPFYASTTSLALPVTMTSFTGKMVGSGTGVVLAWATASEINNYGYTVQRKAEAEASYTDVADAFIAGHGTTVQPQSYSFTDNTVRAAGKYEYRLKQQDLSGDVQYTQSVVVNVALTDVAEVAPREFQLLQNYPNPFNPTTMVKFSVPASGRATMKIYNMVGQEVMTLFDGVAEAGRYYAVPFNATALASGVYFYRLVTEQKTDVRRMMLVK